MPLAGYEQVGRYAELIHRVFGEDVDFVPPGILLELDRPEWRVFKREKMWTTGRVQIAAAPANNGRVQVANRLASGIVSVVTHLTTLTTAAATIRVTVNGPAAATPAPCLALDTRLPFAAGPGAPTVSTQSLIANNNAVIGGYLILDYGSPGGGLWSPIIALPYPVIMDEGANVTVYDTTVNEQLAAYIYGYERSARPEELND